MFLFPFLSSCSSCPVPFSQLSHCSPYPVTLFLSLSSLSSASSSSSLSSDLVPLVLFLSPSHLIVPLILLLCFFSYPLLVSLHVPLPFPLILFLLSCSFLSHLNVPLSCYSPFLSSFSLSSASCSLCITLSVFPSSFCLLSVPHD
jgi:hypothetical protein